MNELPEPKNIFSYVNSILKGGTKFKVTKMYSQYVINHFTCQNEDTIGLIELLNDTRVKFTDQEHYDILYNYLPKVGFIKSNPMKKTSDNINPKIYQHVKKSKVDILRILNEYK